MKLCMESVHDMRSQKPSDPPTGPSTWVFYTPEWVSIIKKFFFKVLILYTNRKLIKNWANINKRVASELQWFEDFENQVVI